MSLRLKLFLDRTLGAFLVLLLHPFARLLGKTMRRDHSLRPQGDILIIKMLGGGSMVTAMPALYGIRKAYPNVKLRLFTTRAVKPFAEVAGIFDDILALDDASLPKLFFSGMKNLWTCVGSDTVIDLEVYSFFTTVLSLFTLARNRLGFFFEETGFRQCLHTHRVFFHPASPLYKHYDRMAELIGAAPASVEDCANKLRAMLGIGEKTGSVRKIAVGCGCSDLFHVRKLTPRQWSRDVFMEEISHDGKVVFLGAADDRDEANRIIAAVGDLGESGWRGEMNNECGSLPLRDSLRALAECSDYWGIDSSLLHYARMFGLRCKIFLGPTHPRLLRPIPGLDEKIYYRKTLCSPCVHMTSVPPCHGDNLCMQWLFDKTGDDDPREGWLPVVAD